jgi:1,4-dihydroxy-2-naphthoyl-CoA hydrolase
MRNEISLEQLNQMGKNTLMEQLGMRCEEVGNDYVVLSMPVDHRTHQPMGKLHGGASAALIESVGSIGSALMLDLDKYAPVGLEMNANHVASLETGMVRAKGRIIHAGKRTHVWQVDITEVGSERLICTGRLTVMILEKSIQ